jgi:FXSXX-COOH protein
MNATAAATPLIDLTEVSLDRVATMEDSVLRRALQRIAAEHPDAASTVEGTVAAGFNSALAPFNSAVASFNSAV